MIRQCIVLLSFTISLLVGPFLAECYAVKEIKLGEHHPKLERDDPLNRIYESMRRAEQYMAKEQTGDETQWAEKDALILLEKLIEGIEKQQQQSKQEQENQQKKKEQSKKPKMPKSKPENSAKKKNANKDETPRNNKGLEKQKRNDSDTPLDMTGEEWGTMPPMMRKELIDSMQENLPAKYKELLKLYYKELSETN